MKRNSNIWGELWNRIFLRSISNAQALLRSGGAQVGCALRGTAVRTASMATHGVRKGNRPKRDTILDVRMSARTVSEVKGEAVRRSITVAALFDEIWSAYKVAHQNKSAS